jgi:FHA domain
LPQSPPTLPIEPDFVTESDDTGMIGEPPMILPPPEEDTPKSAAAEIPPVVVEPMTATPVHVDNDTDATRVSLRRKAKSQWRLVLPDGQQFEVNGSVLVGRDAGAIPQWPNAQLLSVADPEKSVSKTHAAFEVVDGVLSVIDLGSTNGVVVTTSDGREIELDPRQRIELEPGSDVELGDVVIQIEKG